MEKYDKFIIGKSVGHMNPLPKSVIQKNIIDVSDDFNFSTSWMLNMKKMSGKTKIFFFCLHRKVFACCTLKILDMNRKKWLMLEVRLKHNTITSIYLVDVQIIPKGWKVDRRKLSNLKWTQILRRPAYCYSYVNLSMACPFSKAL